MSKLREDTKQENKIHFLLSKFQNIYLKLTECKAFEVSRLFEFEEFNTWRGTEVLYYAVRAKRKKNNEI